METASAKRLLDLTLAVPGLVAAAPIIGVCWVAVKLDSPGPGLFRQVRVGREGAPFTCLKLRTMRSDTPNVPTHEVDRQRDTRVGRWLRRTRLDELPQLWNVVVGDMSLVGPRPCLPHQQDLIAERATRGVLAARPGITGLAQVRGYDMRHPRNLARVDRAYLRQPTIGRDLALLAETVGFRRRSQRRSAVSGDNRPEPASTRAPA